MAFLKKANGTSRAVVPSVGTYNAIVHALNSGGGTRMSAAGVGNRTLISVRNAGQNAINYGNVVALPFWKREAGLDSGVTPAYLYSEIGGSAMAKDPPWGLAVEQIPAGGMGLVQVTGLATVMTSGLSASATNERQYVAPTSTGWLAPSDTGSARLLSYDANGYASILLNASGGGGNDTYDGPFAVSYSSGYITVSAGTVFAGTVLVPVSSYTFEASTSPGEVMYFTMRLFYNSVDSYHADIYNYNNPAYAHSQGSGYTDWHYAVILGTYDADSGNLTQWQHGDIFVAGRLV